RSTNELNQQEVDHWEDLFRKFFQTHTKEEIYREAVKRRIMLFPVFTAGDLADYEQLKKRGYFQEIEHPELGRMIKYPGQFVKSSEPMWQLRRKPPLIGEHNREVYVDELGLADRDVTALKAAGAI
ncbi:MAG: CoA transferase, partial [Chloroflexi bacterium]|nr:CoA transferase [Chloroflexota bacterium]